MQRDSVEADCICQQCKSYNPPNVISDARISIRHTPQSSPHNSYFLLTTKNMASIEMTPPASAGIKKLVCRVCQKGFSKAEHLRVSYC
jgi:hypothetical protein